MSSLDNVVAPSVTVACTVGPEPLMFPTGPTEVMVNPLEPPRTAAARAASGSASGSGPRPRVGPVRSLPPSRSAHRYCPPYHRSRRMLAWLTRREVYPKTFK
jgi:hypothetical protein